MAVIYHYTEYVALDGILNNGVIHLNNILTMNDASEMRYYIDMIINAVIDRLNRNNKKKEAQNLLTYVDNEIKDSIYYAAYAACFSEYRDDAAQWDRYGRNGQGVCIGFDETLLRQIISGVISLQHVFYDVDLAEQPLIDALYEVADQPVVDFDAAVKIMNELCRYSTGYKHPSFSSEKEVRLVASPLICDNLDSSLKYKISHNRIKKYYPFDIKSACAQKHIDLEDLVTEVIIGPISTQPKELLREYFCDIGLKKLANRVTYSQCPLNHGEARVTLNLL